MKRLNAPGGTPPPPTPPSRPGAPQRPGRLKALLPLALGAAILFSAFNLFTHRENRYEKLATDVTRALAANDMRPVEKEFNALTRPKLENRAKVGGLSDFVNAEGALRGIKEQPQSDGKPNVHAFIATFEKGRRAEDLTVDADGKIVDFHVTPLEEK
ncbi:MAG: hypothetical protein NVS2B3_17650 [Vulcanimicrobiaceae bacterium]